MLRTSVVAVGILTHVSSIGLAQQPALVAAPSTRATTVVTIAPPRRVEGVVPVRIRIDYGQPHLRGRALHEGGLVPLDSVWRLGANEATALETDVDLTLGGHVIPKGKYSLYALPSAAGWKLIVNKNTGQWGTDYDATHDLVRLDLRKRSVPNPVESLSIYMIPRGGTASGELRIAWGHVELSAPWAMRVP